jgi:hypothetical protein
MNIFIKIKNSIYNPDYYNEVLAKPFSYSFKYFLVFALLFALVFTIVATIRFIPAVNLLSQKAPELANYFPQELTITIKDGAASSNVQEPYFIKVPKNTEETNSMQPDLENMVVIDTKNKFDISTFNSYKTFIILNSDSIAYIDNGKISISPLSSIKEFVLNKSTVVKFIDAIKPFLVVLCPIVFVGAFIVGFFAVLLKVVYLLFGALLIWLVAKIKGVKIGYGKSYQAGMHLITSAILITSILNAFSAKLTFTYLFTILLIVSAVLNLNKEVAQPAAVATPIA